MKRISQILVVATMLVVAAAVPSSWTTLSADGVGVAVVATARAQSPAELGPRREGDDIVLGKADAPLVLIEYASLTCPHCARFHNEVLPRLKSQYIDGGRLKLVYRDFPLDRVALQAAQVARCVPTERYYAFLEVLFRQQEQWTAGRDPAVMIDRVKQFAALAGLPRDRASACVDDQSMQMKIVGAAQAGEKDYKVSGTPTFVINGKRHTGGPSFEDLDKALRDALGKP
jgi:protein-disulfide isomerase